VCVDEVQCEGVALSYSCRPSLRLFFVFFERERKAGTALLSLGDAVGGDSEAGEQRFMEEPPPRAEGEKGLPLRAKLNVKCGGHVGGGSPTSGPGSPLMSIVAIFSSPPPGGSPTSGLGSQLMAMGTTPSSLPPGGVFQTSLTHHM
jgi:hypothetical protein